MRETLFLCLSVCLSLLETFYRRGNMNRFIATFVVFMVVTGSQILSAPTHDLEENIHSNLIEYEEERTPQDESEESALENPYIVEITRRYLKFQTPEFPAQIIRLKESQSEQIQKLSLAFVTLLNNSKLTSTDSEETPNPQLDWKELNPSMTLSSSGISISFTEPTQDETIKDEFSVPSEHEHILWKFLTNYVRNIFEMKTKELKVPAEYGNLEFLSSGEGDSFQDFINFLWRIMKLSVDYAEFAFDGWTTTPQPDVERRSTSATLFAFEEPFPVVHSFPAEEFEKRRRDIDSIFYGRGIV